MSEMGRPRAVNIAPDGLVLEDTGARLPLYSGALQYWRLERPRWAAILRAVRTLGFRCVETYVPWSEHETARGRFDFSGARDLDAFLRLCVEEDLYVTVRPGPHINAEMTLFGYPEHIIMDPRMQARTASGTPAIHAIPPKAFPIVGYCSEEFYTEVAVWFDAVCPILARHQYPQGRIVLVQADNEHSYFFKMTPYDVDYSPAAQAHYRRTLRERHGTISALNAAYGAGYGAFEEIEPPRAFVAETARDLPRYLDWARAKERYLTDGLARIAGMLRERGLDRIPISHNTPGVHGLPYNGVAIERTLDVQGVDYYVHADEYDTLKRGCLYLTGTSRLPFIPEFGAGTWPWWRPITPEDAEANALTALMHGVKAINYYMLVERERWLGSPIGRRGDVREPEGTFYRRLLRFLEETGFPAFTRRVDVLLLYARDYERHAFAARLLSPPFFPDAHGPFGDLARHEVLAERDLGLGCDVPRALRAWWETCYRALSDEHYAFALGDTESEVSWLRRYRAIVCPGFPYLARETQERLRAYAAAGGTLLMGPVLPVTDEAMDPCTVLRDADIPTMRILPAADQLAGALRASDIAPLIEVDAAGIDIALHEQGARRILFVANPTAQARRVTLGIAGARALDGLWQRESVEGEGSFTATLAARAISVWEVR